MFTADVIHIDEYDDHRQNQLYNKGQITKLEHQNKLLAQTFEKLITSWELILIVSKYSQRTKKFVKDGNYLMVTITFS